MRIKGIAEPLRFSAAFADGRQIWAFRYASDDAAPTLYQKPQHGGWALASEPLGDDAEAWTPIAQGQLIHLHDGVQEARAIGI